MGKKRKFYRATLPTIVWDPVNKKALAEFVNGQFITEDEDVAELLKDRGYPEVKLDVENPPELIPDPVPIVSPDVKILPSGLTEKAAVQMKINETLKKGPGFTAVGDALIDEDEGVEVSAKIKKKKPGRKLKRRNK